MKQFCLLLAAVCIIYSCTQTNSSTTSASSTTAQRNLDASRVINNAFETGDVSKIDSVVAADFVDHTDHGDVKGRDSLKAMIQMIKNNLKDIKMEVMSETADSNGKVFTQMHFTGNSDGKMMPPGHIDMHEIEVTRYNDGKAVEHWAYGELQEMAKMMSQMMGAPRDSTKKK
jgi:predicted SnoaL-like aldol condensation-catalyzing enzyme